MRLRKCCLAMALLGTAGSAFGTTLFSDNFDTTASTNYNVNLSSADNKASFLYDYSADRVPSAPRSTGGSTIGVKMESNLVNGAVAGLTISPKNPSNLSQNMSFSGNYVLSFDMWMNAVGPFPAGGTGSTEHFSAGIGYNNSTVNRVTGSGTGTGSGTWFAVSGEGGALATSTTARDYMAYNNNGVFITTTSVYSAGSQDNAATLYANAFPSIDAPFGVPPYEDNPPQGGTTAAGSQVFQWRRVDIYVENGTVSWNIDYTKIATITSAAQTIGNISIGYFDAFASIAASVGAYNFGLVDNISVSDQVPEPASLALLSLGSLALLMRRRKVAAA